MKSFRPRASSSSRCLIARLAAFLLVMQTAHATIDGTATQQVWKLKYGVTDAQLADPNWLNQDADGDGISNGNEMIAGTNPFNSAKTIKVSSVAKNGANVDLQFPTEQGKLYQVQSSATLGSAATWVLQPVGAPVQILGNGSTTTLSVPYVANTFYRVVVSDTDSDGDGLADWLERSVGLDPNASQSVSGVNDHDYVTQQIALPTTVTISAPDTFASKDGPTAGRLTITRSQTLFPMTVNYNVSGTAVPSSDYSPLPGSVTFAAHGANSADVMVTPMAAASIVGSRSVTATLATPASTAPFKLGSQSQATVIINDTTAATGTGLTARYYDTSSGTYADAANFGQQGAYSFIRSASPTTSGTALVTYTGSPITGLVVGNQVKINFTSGSTQINNVAFNNQVFTVTAVSGSTFTVSMTSASSFGGTTSTNGNCFFSIQSFTHPATVTRVDPTVNFDWQYGTPNGVVIAPLNSPENYSATWECYLSPSIAGAYTFQLDADDKAEVLLDTGAGLTQIVEHNWNTPGADPVGTFKQSAPITLAIPGTPAARYHMVVHHVETTGDARCRLQWLVPGTTSFVNIPQANQFTHTQAMTYSYSGGNAVISPTGGHTLAVGDSVPLSFSSGVLFTPGMATGYNKNYIVTAVGGTFPTNNYTVSITGNPTVIAGAGTTAGSATVTVPSTAGLVVGMVVTGNGLTGSELITAIGSGNITLSAVASSTQASTTLTFTGVNVIVAGAATTAGSATVTVPSTAGLAVGMAVAGTGLPVNEFVTSVGTTTVTISTGTNVTAQASTTLTFTGSGIPISGAATTANNAIVTVPSTAGLAVGMYVSGTGVPSNEYIVSIGTGNVTLTTGTGVTTQASTTLTFTPTGTPIVIAGSTTTAGGPTILTPSINGLAVGMSIMGTGVPANQFITSLAPGLISTTSGTGYTAQASTTLTFALPATGSQTGSGFVLNNSTSATTGLYNLCYANTSFSNSPGRVGVDSAITGGNNGIWNSGTPDANLIQPETFSARWTGQVQPQYSEDYTFVVQADDGCALWINGQPQVLKMAPSAQTGGSTYAYDNTTGNTVISYSGLAVPPGSFLLGEPVRLDPSSGNLAYSPTTSPTYTYDGTTGLAVITYSNLTTVTAGGYAVGENVEIDPTSGSLNAISQTPYTITAVTPTTFTVNIGTGTFVTGSGNVTISDNRNYIISKLYGTANYSYTSTTGATVIDYSTLISLGVPQNSFTTGGTVELTPASGNLLPLSTGTYTITASTATTFTVNFGIGVAVTGTGTVSITAPNAGPIPASATTGFAVNFGPGKTVTGSTGAMNVDVVNKTLKDWSSNGNERFVRLPMIGGVRYDIQLDYYEATGASRCFLSWYSASQTKQIIPQERLYPTSVPAAPPEHISPTDATGIVGGAFSYNVQGSNGGTVSISGNPSWLTLSGGVLSGTPTPGSGGDYQVIITVTNGTGTTTSAVNLHVDENAGNVTREFWNGVSGTTVASIPTSTAPSGTSSLTTLQAPTGFGSNYGQRIRGYIEAPVTGNYYFWLSANSNAELWIANDDQAVNTYRRAYVTTGSTTPLTWTAEANQKSPWLALEQGKKYYFEVLHAAGAGGGDNLAIGWSKPGDATTGPSQVIPGYVLSPYVASASTATGTLYVANMLSQSSAVTNGVGASTLRLSADENTAYMTRSYSGLTGPLTSEHIHTDPYLTHPSTIVYDIDTPATPGDGLMADGVTYKWTILPVGTLSKADIIEIIKEGKAYINLHTVAYPNGEIRGNYTLSNGTQIFTPPPSPPSFSDDHATDNGAVRFLTQATFGANISEIQALKGMASYSAWIDDQFTKGPTLHLPEVNAREDSDVFGPFDVRLSFDTWWKTSMTANDQLRQRVAFALSQIHVVSGQGPLEDNSQAISYFYDTLLTNAFGNFRDILIGTTLTPSMGRYLDMLRNDKPDITVGRSPNENYAREIKQLFSIGLYRLWPDGTLMLDSTNSPIDTYTQREIVGLAHVFTGWDYGYDGPLHTSFASSTTWQRPMRETPARHFTGVKRIINNVVLPGLPSIGGQPLDPYATHTAMHFADSNYQALPSQELNAVHDALFNHPNVGPFICRQLIQRLVTSNPSRDYLYRVVQKFNDNGSGVRGDMKTVIKAILLDYEARSTDLLAIPAFGKQREPVQRVANAGRAFRPGNITGTYVQNGSPTITITTSAPHLLQAGNNVFLEFTDATAAGAQPAPTTGTYPVISVTNATTYTINAPTWISGTYNQPSGSNVMTITLSGHWLPVGGQAYFDFTSGTANNLAGFDNTVRTVVTSTAFDSPGGTTNTSGTTFTITAPDTTARSGNVMIPRYTGTYQTSGSNYIIDTFYGSGGATNYGTAADHNLLAGDNVFLNFLNTRDTTSGNPTTTANDLVYPIASVPDSNTFVVAQINTAANAAINSDNQVMVFPLKSLPLVRNGTIFTRPSTYTMDNTDLELNQTPLNSPTVFNYFLPDYKYAGALASQGITTPEFQLTAETSVVNQANFFYNGLFNPSNTTGISSFKSGTNAIVLDFSSWMGNATDLGLGAGPQPTQVWTSNANVSTLIDKLNTLLVAGQLPTSAKTAILNFIGGPISAISTGNPCTITTSSAHGLKTGDSVNITGVSGGTFGTSINATFSITVPTGSTTTFTVPVNCTSISGLNLTNSNASISSVAYTNATPSAQNIRDRLRAIIHFILTSPDYTIQR